MAGSMMTRTTPAGTDVSQRAGADVDGLGVVFDDLVGDQQVEDGFRKIVGDPVSAIRSVGSNADLNLALDPAGTLSLELPTAVRCYSV
jgi:hypothetical protein